MTFQKDKIASWVVPTVIVIIVLGVIAYTVSKKDGGPIFQIGGEQQDEGPRKGFAEEELNPKQKAEYDGVTMEEALKSGNTSDCDSLFDEEKKQQCYDGINFANFLKSGDEKNCEKLFSETLRITCYDRIYVSSAINTGNLETCQKVVSAPLKQSCIDQIQASLSRNAKTVEECNLIQNAALKNECVNNVAFSTSIAASNLQGCNLITDNTLKARCTAIIQSNIQVATKSASSSSAATKTSTEKLTACDSLAGALAQKCKDDANFALAFEKEDLSYCNRISTTQKQNDCLQQQGDKLNQSYFRKAEATGDLTLCEKITNLPLKQLCLDSF